MTLRKQLVRLMMIGGWKGVRYLPRSLQTLFGQAVSLSGHVRKLSSSTSEGWSIFCRSSTFGGGISKLYLVIHRAPLHVNEERPPFKN